MTTLQQYGVGLLCRLVIIIFTITMSSQSFAGLIFINEIHYDNTGSDTGEAIEIAAPINTITDDLFIRLYNGASESAYRQISLADEIFTNSNNGYGFISVAASSLQNGASDGIALFQNDMLLQFISYEGTLTVNDDLLDNITSQDIGVSENSSTPIGFSLQLTGIGSRYQDFIWQAASANSFGTINPGQTFTPVSAPNMIYILPLMLLFLFKVRKRHTSDTMLPVNTVT